MKAQISAVILGVIAAAACGTSTQPTSASPVDTVEEQAQPLQEAARPMQPTAAPVAQPPVTPSAAARVEQVNLGGALLSLEGCELTVEASGTKQKHTLPMPEGCTFGKSKPGGPVQVETTARGATVLVVSSKPVGGRDCDTRVRAVVVGKQGVAVSAKEQEIAMCGADGPFDRPVFIALAASAMPLD